MKLNSIWKDKIKEEIENDSFRERITSFNKAAQWLITFLYQKGKPVQVINLGAGVKRIVLADTLCPHCQGKGYQRRKEN